MLTAKGKYALKALIYLSSLEPGEKAQGGAISKADNIGAFLGYPGLANNQSTGFAGGTDCRV